MARRLAKTFAAAAESRTSVVKSAATVSSSSSSHAQPPVAAPFAINLLTRRWFSSSFSWTDFPVENPKRDKKQNHRLSSVIDAVNDRKLPPELRGRSNSIRSETDIINVVEQRIWHSMEEGHFENLPGKGKPLDFSTNPHADPAEDTLYRILSRNGCAPEWVELNKEIRSKISVW